MSESANAATSMDHLQEFYIDGAWCAPVEPGPVHEIVNPITEHVTATLAMGSAADVDRAVAAAAGAFPAYSRFTRAERQDLLHGIQGLYEKRLQEIADAIALEIGCPATLARDGQAMRGAAHVRAALDALARFEADETLGSTLVTHEPIGVCGLITPWNWPMNQLCVKIAPALAAGCTMVVKPSEFAPLSALMLADIMHEAGVPRGVFNLVNGSGATVGQAIAAHPRVDMVSFTGSTEAGIQVARTAAATVKRVAQELGGKSANIILPDADLEPAVKRGVAACFANSGQSCSIPTRMLVPVAHAEQAYRIAAEAARAFSSGPDDGRLNVLGPMVNRAQFERVQALIRKGIEEGARLLTGGPGRPEGVERGYYIRPTVFGDVIPGMSIAREEIFGPVLAIMPYRDEADAIGQANDSAYGLAAYVQSADLERARRVARQLRAGGVHLNYPPVDFNAPFGGYKCSGNGREWGLHGIREYMEVKSIVGFAQAGR